ncbi:hypothetical protein ACHAW5_009938 [Stephanodiscus triporus]|uniref:FYVE-type domain-containing protein n=1 Tax=Stephanodiscus triporus TaxID=2934178 RepID=A0ABD3QTK9_9STRA
MAITKDTSSMTASIRSLRSLKLVPPPPPPPSHKPYQGYVIHHENWAFPAPYAPHAQLGEKEETRDERDTSESDDRFCARDGATESTRKVDGVGRQRLTLTPKVDRMDKGASTQPRLPQPQKDEAMAAYSSEKRRSNYFGPGSRSRSPGPAIPVADEAPTECTGKDDFARNRRTRDAPVLTQNRIDQRVTAQSTDSNSIDVGTDGNGGDQEPWFSSSKPSSNSSSNKKITMVGMNKVHSRTLIPPTVYHNTVTDLWIVTINTNSKVAHSIPGFDRHANNNVSNNSVKAYSFSNEKEARASAYAMAPPVMLPFDQCKECTICATTFTFFKRPRHCRNCGIITCNNYSCCTTWPKKMIPETFNFKNENNVNVCTSCNVLTKRFKHALILGQYDTAIELYRTGNINLRNPFAFKGKSDNEILLPIHCAIEGKSEELLRWLVDVHYCPIHVASMDNSESGGVAFSVNGMIKSLASNKEKKYDFVPTLKTSKGRSLIDIAMRSRDVGILRYLINEKGVSVYEVEELELALGAVEALAKSSEKGKKTNRCGDGENVAVMRSTTEQRSTIDTSPERYRMLSHVFVPPHTENTFLPRDIHGAGF